MRIPNISIKLIERIYNATMNSNVMKNNKRD